jgi:hypothetical protein
MLLPDELLACVHAVWLLQRWLIFVKVRLIAIISLNKNFDQGVNVIKRFTAVSYDISLQARAFVPGKPFQPSLMFASKARGLP